MATRFWDSWKKIPRRGVASIPSKGGRWHGVDRSNATSDGGNDLNGEISYKRWRYWMYVAQTISNNFI